jgi:hypothetical protein
MKTVLNYIVSIYIISILFCFNYCFAQTQQQAQQREQQSKTSHCITQFEHGIINWTTGNILAIGKASVEDNTQTSQKSVPGSARADANRHIIDILKQLKINNALSVGEYASRNDIILAGIEKTARDAVTTKQYYTSALSVEIIVETSIFGGLLQLVLPEKIKPIPQINLEHSKINDKKSEADLYTGIIVDARKLEIEPVLNPVIISEQGHDIYSSSFISREFAVQNGVCKYYCDMEQAVKDERIGTNPLVIKGLRNAGKENSAIIISMSDYQTVEKTAERHTFLKECRFIIVHDGTHIGDLNDLDSLLRPEAQEILLDKLLLPENIDQ